MAKTDRSDKERIKPTPELAARRLAWSNGRDPNQCSDTIGRLWAWGYLEGAPRHDSDTLRDAGRAYAEAFWRHYGKTAAASIGGYKEMIAGGSIQTVIEDPVRDVIQHERFRSLDAQLGPTRSDERLAVVRFCVDQHGQSDPVWLQRHMAGWPDQTATIRAKLEHLQLMMRSADPVRRRHARSDYKLLTIELRRVTLALSKTAHSDARHLRMGLCWLVDHEMREKAKRRNAEGLA